MQLIITGKNMEISDWLRSYVERKFAKLDRYLPNIVETRVELTTESTKNSQDRHVCQVTVRTKGSILRAEERAADVRDAVDAVREKMYRQIDRYRGKRWERNRVEQPAGEEVIVAEEEEEEEEEGQPTIVRRKRFAVSPMDENEAIEQMELLGHDFFVFYNADTAGINVVYKRKDGQYGLLQPELS
jgi:putative sigma-54 modulation protein